MIEKQATVTCPTTQGVQAKGGRASGILHLPLPVDDAQDLGARHIGQASRAAQETT